MKTIRALMISLMLLGSLGLMAGCASRSGGCSSGNCKCAPDRNCCDGCRTGGGCNR